MIVIGLDVHKQSVTAVAVDEAGRPLDEKVILVGSEELLDWAGRSRHRGRNADLAPPPPRERMSCTGDTGELLAEVRRRAERFPLPHPIWHRFVPEMHEVIRDLFVALDVIAEVPRAQAELIRQVEGAAERPLDGAGGPAVAKAHRRMRTLPVPEGEHPYLDEILITLEAADAVLAALAVAEGEAAFARRLQQG